MIFDCGPVLPIAGYVCTPIRTVAGAVPGIRLQSPSAIPCFQAGVTIGPGDGAGVNGGPEGEGDGEGDGNGVAEGGGLAVDVALPPPEPQLLSAKRVADADAT